MKKSKRRKYLKLLIILLILFELSPAGKMINGYIEDAVVAVRSDNSASSSTEEQTNQGTTSSTPIDGDMTVTFIDVGQGDATLIQTSTDTVLMDTGSHTARESLLNALGNAGVTKIDYLILTHPDEDHIGNGNTIVDTYPVECVLAPDMDSDTKAWNITKAAIEEKSIPVEHPMIDTEYALGDASMLVITPSEIDESSKNNCSIGIKLTHGTDTFVMCGDAEEEAEQIMVRNFGHDLEADVLKCGHHGSATATSDQFLAYVNPTYAIISCGENNRYGHPHAEVLSKLEDDDVMIYRTDRQGTIRAVSDGSNISFSAEK